MTKSGDNRKKHGPKKPKLERETFRTSRLLDFCSLKELIAQTGPQPDAWPLVALKELVDKALDACEDAKVAPEVKIVVDQGGITVTDNGPGIPPDTVNGVLDFTVRVSSREAYISPTRAAQGNALKTLVAMPFVLHGKQGRVEIGALGIRHEITIGVDRIRQEPLIDHHRREDPLVKTGTSVLLHWPDSASSLLTSSKSRFLQIAEDYTVINPHLTMVVDWFGVSTKYEATVNEWKKWLPSWPTNPHWYGAEHFERLVAAYIAADADRGEDRTVRELVVQFDGLTGTAKQKAVLESTGLARMNLSALRNGDGPDSEKIAKLLAAMKAHCKPVNPAALGIIGNEHFQTRYKAMGAEMETFQYRKVLGVTDEIPWIVETAFAWHPQGEGQRLITGVNWSPGIVNPFREVGKFGESLDAILEQQRAGRKAPVVLALHLALSRVEYTDRGKSAVVIGGAKVEDNSLED